MKNYSMHIVMLAAGAGSRFAHLTNVPKPFIEFNGETMCEHVARQLKLQDVTLIVQNNHKQYVEHFKSRQPFTQINCIPSATTIGPLGSLLLGTLNLPDPNWPILVVDSDSFVRLPELSPDFYHRVPNPYRSTVFSIRATKNSVTEATVFRYVRTTIVEGGVEAPNLLNTGIYFFPSLNSVRSLASRILFSDPKSEYKISDLINADSLADTAVLEDGQFVNLGTPELLREYELSHIHPHARSGLFPIDR